MKQTLFLLFVMITGLSRLDAQQNCACTATSVNFNTGVVRPANSLIPVGGSDAGWTLITAPATSGLATPATPFVIEPLTGWGGATPADRATMAAGSRWISPFNSPDYEVNNPSPQNPFVFQFKFCVCNPGRFRFNGLINADDEATLYLDGTTLLASCPYWDSVRRFTDTVTLSAGTHYLTIRLRNIGGRVMGVNVNGAIQPVGTSSLMGYECCDRTGGIRGQKFNDVNCNGRLDAGDTAMAGWTVTLMPGGYTATTDVLGYYYFTGLTPGTYTVTETMQPGWTAVTPASTSVTVAAGSIATANFLNSRCGSSRCNDTCYWKVTGNNILDGNNIFGTLSKHDVRVQTSAVNRGIITASGLLGWNTMSPTAYLHVNCSGNNQESGTLSDVRFEKLERGDGNVLVINSAGYVMDSKVPLNAVRASVLADLQHRYDEEKARNDRMEAALETLKAQVQQLLQGGSSETAPASGSRLYQNTPNPYKEGTTIGYYLEPTAGNAAIVISDAQGKELQQHKLTGQGEGRLSVQTGTFAQGIYYYTLWVDGRKIDTKRMIYAP